MMEILKPILLAIFFVIYLLMGTVGVIIGLAAVKGIYVEITKWTNKYCKDYNVTKEQFLIKYLLARANNCNNGIDVKAVLQDAETAWNLIRVKKWH